MKNAFLVVILGISFIIIGLISWSFTKHFLGVYAVGIMFVLVGLASSPKMTFLMCLSLVTGIIVAIVAWYLMSPGDLRVFTAITGMGITSGGIAGLVRLRGEFK